jgi:hypothetical protein
MLMESRDVKPRSTLRHTTAAYDERKLSVAPAVASVGWPSILRALLISRDVYNLRRAVRAARMEQSIRTRSHRLRDVLLT